ncbi:MAG: hypothetical protein ACXVHB_31750 [Solirubrobacteraceae bacterium]
MLALLALLVSACFAVAIDFASALWRDRPMTASLVSSGIVIAATGLVLNAWLDRRHKRRWASVRAVALADIRDTLVEVRDGLESVIPKITRPDIIVEQGHTIHGLAVRVRRVIASWADAMMDAGAEDYEVFSRLRDFSDVIQSVAAEYYDATSDFTHTGVMVGLQEAVDAAKRRGPEMNGAMAVSRSRAGSTSPPIGSCRRVSPTRSSTPAPPTRRSPSGRRRTR